MRPFDVIDVAAWPPVGGEPLGSKRKIWLQDPSGVRWLFKAPREATGDDWAEKIAAELGTEMGVPCPTVELVRLGDQRGSITRSFIPVWADAFVRLVHGNELLYEIDPSYPRTERRWVAQHTVDGVLDGLVRFQVQPSDPITLEGRELNAPEVFTGYLAFDAWIGNQDRHHENWGILVIHDPEDPEPPYLAPSFDHAASLGQILNDQERTGRLDTKDRRYSIQTWAPKARSHLYLSSSDPRPARTLDAFSHAAQRYPAAAALWRRRIAEVKMARVSEIVDAVPTEWMSAAARRFAVRMLEINRDSLLALEIL